MENILDHSPSEKLPKSGKSLMLFHLLEIFLVVILIFGYLEKTEHTQFISGVSLTYWGLILLALLSLIIPILYERAYRSKVINFLFAGIFGFLLFTNLLGKLEQIERTQFIPEVSLFDWAFTSLLFVAPFMALIHEIKRKASWINILIAIIIGISISFFLLAKLEMIENSQFFEGIRLKMHIHIPALIILASIPLLLYRKSFHKEYRYHYIRFFLLLFIGF